MAFPFSEIGKSVREAGIGWKSGVWFGISVWDIRHPSKAVKEKLNMGLEFRGEV